MRRTSSGSAKISHCLVNHDDFQANSLRSPLLYPARATGTPRGLSQRGSHAGRRLWRQMTTTSEPCCSILASTSPATGPNFETLRRPGCPAAGASARRTTMRSAIFIGPKEVSATNCRPACMRRWLGITWVKGMALLWLSKSVSFSQMYFESPLHRIRRANVSLRALGGLVILQFSPRAWAAATPLASAP